MADLYMPHGQYKGKRVIDLPSHYLEWIRENWDPGEIREAAKRELIEREDRRRGRGRER